MSQQNSATAGSRKQLKNLLLRDPYSQIRALWKVLCSECNPYIITTIQLLCIFCYYLYQKKIHSWDSIQKQRNNQWAVILVYLVFSVFLKAIPHKLITRLRQIESSTFPFKFVWNKPKQNKSFSMEGKNLWVFMKCSISSQRFERTASTSNNFNNAPVSKGKIYLKPTFQAILRANVFWCTNHHIRDFFYILYEQIEKTQVQKGSQEYQASWVFRQDNSI